MDGVLPKCCSCLSVGLITRRSNGSSHRFCLKIESSIKNRYNSGVTAYPHLACDAATPLLQRHGD